MIINIFTNLVYYCHKKVKGIFFRVSPIPYLCYNYELFTVLIMTEVLACVVDVQYYANFASLQNCRTCYGMILLQ